MGLRNVARLGQQQGHGVLRSRDDVRLRRVDHHHTSAGRRFDVDVVQTDSCAADHDEVRRGLEDLGRHLRGRADDQRVRTAALRIRGDARQQLREVELDIHLVARGAEPVQAAIGDFFGHQDARHVPILIDGFRVHLPD